MGLRKRRKLIIVSASSRLREKPTEPIPAIQRYDGIFFRVLRKLLRDGKLREFDILIVSEKYGLLSHKDKISHHAAHPGPWGSLSLDEKAVNGIRKENLKKLKKIVNKYSEIYVNLGREYMKLIGGFEEFTRSKITFGVGTGLIPKAAHMRECVLFNQ